MLLNLPQFISTQVTGRPESLFKPDFVQFGPELRTRIEGASVLIIGGAGSIGSAFAKTLLRCKPARLIVVDANENALTELVRDLRSGLGYHIPEEFRCYPFDFGDSVFEKMFRKAGPFDIVANFAAHKHVRSEKDPYSIEAMMQNNVFKAKHLLDLLAAEPPKHFFCVSTDKAANPANVMGASKKLMEQIALSYASVFPVATARFANVAFSQGSLLAGFLERLAKRQPLSAPRDVERYFLSPEEAGQLCLLACVLGDSGDVFFPKLDARSDLRSFSDIAVRLLETLGFEPDVCSSEQEAREKASLWKEASKTWPVYFFASDTSGEKPVEEFFTAEEILDLKRFASIGIVKNPVGEASPSPLLATQIVDELRAVLQKDEVSKREIIEVLQHFVPDFQHLETGKNLDTKM